jgi:hypothetical protein
MALVQYLDDDTTALDGYVFATDPEAGTQSAAVEIHLWNEGDDTAPNVIVVQRGQSLSDPTRIVATGLPPQDELMGRVRIVGYDNTGDSTWTIANTAWQPVGAYSALVVGDIPAGCAVYYEYAVHASGNAQEVGYTVYPIPIYGEYSQPLSPYVSKFERGILHGIGDPNRSEVVWTIGDAFQPAASGPADEDVYVGAGMILFAGRLYGIVGGAHTLNQNDSAAAALAASESYKVTFSAGVTAGVASVTATKGTKAVSPTAPAVPAGEVLLGYVTVDYQVGGTSVVETADIDWSYIYSRYHCADGGGMNLRVNPGQAIGGGTWRYKSAVEIVDLTAYDDSTCYVWLLASGLVEVTADDEYPEDTALPLAAVTLAASVITVIEDRRVYAGDTVQLDLAGDLPGSVGLIARKLVGHEHLVLESVIYWLSDNGGTSGQTQLDLEVNGSTVYTSFATEDWRPTFAHDATGDALQIDWPIHESTILRRGDLIELSSIEDPPDGVPVSAMAVLICRKP